MAPIIDSKLKPVKRKVSIANIKYIFSEIEILRYLKSGTEIIYHTAPLSNVPTAKASLTCIIWKQTTLKMNPITKTATNLKKYIFCFRFTLYKLTKMLLMIMLNICAANNKNMTHVDDK
jgi:hypothetical protein